MRTMKPVVSLFPQCLQDLRLYFLDYVPKLYRLTIRASAGRVSLIDLQKEKDNNLKWQINHRPNPYPNNDGFETKGCGVKSPRIFDCVEAETSISQAYFQII